MSTPKTLFDKVWDAHVVKEVEGGIQILYIDRHFIHEVTSPQAFAGIENRGINVFRPKQITATADHNIPTKDQHLPIKEELSRTQVDKLYNNCKNHNVNLYPIGHKYQGIVHVIGPELGYTLPGMTIVCGDSHTSTHGAFGNIAFGIGTSQVEQVFASQCLLLTKPKKMRINVEGDLKKGVTAKDVILYIISKLTSSGGTGYFIEYAGSTIQSLSMEQRMTICNMSIEMGARGGMIAPDEKTFDYIKDKKFAPKDKEYQEAVSYWKTLYSDKDAVFDVEHTYQAKDINTMITFGTNPGMGIALNENVPTNTENSDSYMKALKYMGLSENESLLGKKINWVFIGSCTNSRIEDLREVAEIVKGKKKASNVTALIVPGSQLVAQQAKSEGIDKVFVEAGFELREPGCSACLGMNEDKIPKDEYCVSTSNRNFEGRQGVGARTLLASPIIAAVTALEGKIVEVEKYL